MDSWFKANFSSKTARASVCIGNYQFCPHWQTGLVQYTTVCLHEEEEEAIEKVTEKCKEEEDEISGGEYVGRAREEASGGEIPIFWGQGAPQPCLIPTGGSFPARPEKHSAAGKATVHRPKIENQTNKMFRLKIQQVTRHWNQNPTVNPTNLGSWSRLDLCWKYLRCLHLVLIPRWMGQTLPCGCGALQYQTL